MDGDRALGSVRRQKCAGLAARRWKLSESGNFAAAVIAFRWRRSGTHLALILAGSVIVAPAALSQPETCLVHWRAEPLDSHKVSVEVSGLADSALRSLRQAEWKIAQWQRLLAVYAQ